MLSHTNTSYWLFKATWGETSMNENDNYRICRRESKRHHSITSVCLSSTISHTHHSPGFWQNWGMCGASCVHRDIVTFSKLLPRGRHCKHKSKLISKKTPLTATYTLFSGARQMPNTEQMFPYESHENRKHLWWFSSSSRRQRLWSRDTSCWDCFVHRLCF